MNLNDHIFFFGDGEMVERVNNFNWSASPHGTPDNWPVSLKITLRNVFNSAFPMFMFWGEELICFYNDAFRKSLGTNGKHPALGKSGKDVWPEMWHIIGPAISEVMSTGRSSWHENKLVPFFRNGKIEEVYFTFSCSVIPDDNAKNGGVLITCLETTESVLSQKKLTESESRLRFALHAGQMGFWELDLKNGTFKTSEHCKANFGLPPDEPFTYEKLKELIHPDDRQRQEQAVNDTLQHGIDYNIEYRTIWPNNTLHWLNIRGQLKYDSEGKPDLMIGVSIDITDAKNSEELLKESETRFRTMAESADVLIAIGNETRDQLETALEQVRLSKEAAELGTFDLDLQNGHLHWDQRCRTLFGLSHNNPVTYEKDFVPGLHPDDRNRIIEVINKLYLKLISNGDYDVEYRTVGAEDGKVRWVRAKGKVYFDSHDKPVRFIGSVLDITEQVNQFQQIERLVEARTSELSATNAALLKTNSELKRSNAYLEEFAHAASHDLKEPIRKIITFTDLLKTRIADLIGDSEKHLLQRIEIAAGRMSMLVTDLLQYSQFSDRPFEKERIDLNESVQQALQDLELDLLQKDVSVHVFPLPTILGYKRQIQQLFQNLISNAIKYSKKDTAPYIEITSCLMSENEEDYYCLLIKDNGIGFEQKYAKKIFYMFARLHDKKEYEGTGLGLSIVKRIVDNHDGFIKVTSVVDEGSVFQVFFPCNQ